jgi:putative endonuclease
VSRRNLILGKQGEESALSYLKKKGYSVLKSNYKTKLGEIDIIATDKDTICFIEVKFRNSLRFGLPQEAVSSFKQKQISKAALQFLKTNNLLNKKSRFDIVSIINDPQNGVDKVDLIQNAFELDEKYSY